MLNGTKSSQNAEDRPISFLLEDDLTGGDGLTYVRLSVRPEDLTRVEPSRLSVQQTLGGAWADGFGPGIRSIQISGHTGWRGEDAVWGGDDGMTVFQNLNDMIFQKWHRRRAEAIKAGDDPDQIKLIFVDKLDEICSVVAPQSFLLKRNRSRPLLMQYQISLAVLENDVDADYGGVVLDNNGKDKQDLAKSSLADLADRLVKGGAKVETWIGSTLGAPAKELMNMTGDVLKQVTRISGASDGVFSALVTVARDLTQAGTNVFRALAVAASIPTQAISRVMEIAGIVSSAYCLIKKMFSSLFMPNYSGFFGASNCSSTAGGSPMSPLRNANALYGLVGAGGAAAALTNIAGSSGAGIASTTASADLAAIKGAIPGLSGSSAGDVSVSLTSQAGAALSALATTTDPVAAKMNGTISALVAGLPDKLHALSSGFSMTVRPPDPSVSSDFIGSLSYTA
jgi:hypothetical protein